MYGEQFEKAGAKRNALSQQQTSAPMADLASASRPSVKEAIQGKARGLRDEADRLDALARALPDDMRDEAQNALFALLYR